MRCPTARGVRRLTDGNKIARRARLMVRRVVDLLARLALPAACSSVCAIRRGIATLDEVRQSLQRRFIALCMGCVRGQALSGHDRGVSTRGTARAVFVRSSKNGVGRPSPRTHQPSNLDAWRAKTPSHGGPGAFGGSGPTAERS